MFLFAYKSEISKSSHTYWVTYIIFVWQILWCMTYKNAFPISIKLRCVGFIPIWIPITHIYVTLYYYYFIAHNTDEKAACKKKNNVCKKRIKSLNRTVVLFIIIIDTDEDEISDRYWFPSGRTRRREIKSVFENNILFGEDMSCRRQ